MSMTGRREMVVALGAVGMGAGLVLLAAASTGRAGDTGDIGDAGPDLSGGRALALAGLAGLVAVLATDRLVRRVVGGLIVLFGAGVAAVTMTAGTGWGRLAMTGGLLMSLGAAVVVVRARRWPTMGARFDTPEGSRRPGRRAEVEAVDPWAALDRGEDPTLDSAGQSAAAEEEEAEEAGSAGPPRRVPESDSGE